MKRTLIVCWLALAAITARPMFAQAPAQTSPPKIRVLILTGSTDSFHPWRGTAPFLQDILMSTGRFDVKLEEAVPGITAATLAGFDVVVDYYNGPRWGDPTEHAVEDFIRSGKGMVAVHCATYGPFFGQFLGGNRKDRRMEGEPWPAYSDMLGMTWKLKDIGHSKDHVFAVQWVDRDNPISRGLPPAFVTHDELYHKIKLKPNAHVVASALDLPRGQGGTGKEEPMIWTVPYGQGRVVVMALGHDLLAMSQPGFMDAFARGTEWAATGNVAPGASALEPATSMPAPAPSH